MVNFVLVFGEFCLFNRRGGGRKWEIWYVVCGVCILVIELLRYVVIKCKINILYYLRCFYYGS